MVSGFLRRNGNGMTITIDNNSFFNRANGQRAILTNLNRIAVLCSVDCRIKRLILRIADFRGKRRGRRVVLAAFAVVVGGRITVGISRRIGAAVALLVRAVIRLGFFSCAVLAAFAVVVGGRITVGVFPRIRAAVALLVRAVIRLGFFSWTVLVVIHHICSAAIQRFGNGCDTLRRQRRGFVCCAIFGRERGHGQHGEHHQTGESAGEETVISPFHAKTSSACIQTQRR